MSLSIRLMSLLPHLADRDPKIRPPSEWFKSSSRVKLLKKLPILVSSLLLKEISRSISRVVTRPDMVTFLDFESRLMGALLLESFHVSERRLTVSMQSRWAFEAFKASQPPPRWQPGWHTETVITLVKEITESVDFSSMPILADALEDAGCNDVHTLRRLRGETKSVFTLADCTLWLPCAPTIDKTLQSPEILQAV